MKFLITLFSLLLCLSGLANDTLYFRLSNPWNTVKDPNGKYLRKCIQEREYFHVWDYNQKNKLVTESFYSDTNFKTKLFCHKYFHEEEGWLQQTRCYENGRLDGYFVGYNKNGDTTSYDIYRAGEAIKSWSLHPEEEDSILNALSKLEVPAEFPGGSSAWNKYLGKHIQYPSSLKNTSITGEVVVKFTVNTEGRVENVQLVKSLHPDLDKEVIRVIQKSPRWKPAMQNQKKVPAYKTQPIRF